VVLQPDPVGRAHLPQAGTDRLEQLGDPEPVSDLDELAAGDDDRPARGQHEGHQGEGGGAVVADVDAPGVRGRAGQCRQRAPAAAADRGARPRLVWTRTPVALTTRRSDVAAGGSAVSATATTSWGRTRPCRHSSMAYRAASLTSCGPSRAAAATRAGSASTVSVRGVARRWSSTTSLPGGRWRRRTGIEPAW